MSVTLGELKEAANSAADINYKPLPEPPAEDTFMGTRLGKNIQSNMPAFKSYTLLDDAAFSGYPYKAYPPTPPPFKANYGQMAVYNSNPTTNVGLPPPPAQAYISQQVGTPVSPINSVLQVPEGTLVMPRNISAQDYSEDKLRGIVQYGELQRQPPYAGSVPMLKNALANDHAMAMKESFRFNRHQNLHNDAECVNVLRHVASCPLCQRYFRCDNRMYVTMIVMLVALFAIIIFLMMKSKAN